MYTCRLSRGKINLRSNGCVCVCVGLILYDWVCSKCVYVREKERRKDTNTMKLSKLQFNITLTIYLFRVGTRHFSAIGNSSFEIHSTYTRMHSIRTVSGRKQIVSTNQSTANFPISPNTFRWWFARNRICYGFFFGLSGTHSVDLICDNKFRFLPHILNAFIDQQIWSCNYCYLYYRQRQSTKISANFVFGWQLVRQFAQKFPSNTHFTHLDEW